MNMSQLKTFINASLGLGIALLIFMLCFFTSQVIYNHLSAEYQYKTNLDDVRFYVSVSAALLCIIASLLTQVPALKFGFILGSVVTLTDAYIHNYRFYNSPLFKIAFLLVVFIAMIYTAYQFAQKNQD